MCRWGDAIARAVVAFLDAVLVGCFRPRPGRRDPLVPKDGLGEVSAFQVSEGVEDRTRICLMVAALMRSLGESFKCEEDHTLRHELNIEDTEHLQRVESVPQSAFQEKSPFQSIKDRLPDCSNSPFPTPLVLIDDMQTPGATYTSHKRFSMSGKRVQTCKQFIYPVLRPIENELQLMELTKDSSPMLPSNPPKWRNLGADSFKKPHKPLQIQWLRKDCPNLYHFLFLNIMLHTKKKKHSLEESKCQIGSPNLLDGGELSKSNSDEKNDVSSLSHWLKPSSADNENQGDVKVCLSAWYEPCGEAIASLQSSYY